MAGPDKIYLIGQNFGGQNCRKSEMWGVYAHYVHLVLASMYLFATVVSYSTIFVSYIRSRRRTISVSTSNDESQVKVLHFVASHHFILGLHAHTLDDSDYHIGEFATSCCHGSGTLNFVLRYPGFFHLRIFLSTSLPMV